MQSLFYLEGTFMISCNHHMWHVAVMHPYNIRLVRRRYLGFFYLIIMLLLVLVLELQDTEVLLVTSSGCRWVCQWQPR